MSSFTIQTKIVFSEIKKNLNRFFFKYEIIIPLRASEASREVANLRHIYDTYNEMYHGINRNARPNNNQL